MFVYRVLRSLNSRGYNALKCVVFGMFGFLEGCFHFYINSRDRDGTSFKPYVAWFMIRAVSGYPPGE